MMKYRESELMACTTQAFKLQDLYSVIYRRRRLTAQITENLTRPLGEPDTMHLKASFQSKRVNFTFTPGLSGSETSLRMV
mmetsp:Transcript_34571/g.60706  ORF Transcript_34571/g.60706 Transcript_34571/m.60706 type:complete len:80 (+) Transcript_34571:139-378(+)